MDIIYDDYQNVTIKIENEYEVERYNYNKRQYYKSILGRIGLLSFVLATIFLNIFLIILSNLSAQDLYNNDSLLKVIVILMIIFYVISSLCYCITIM